MSSVLGLWPFLPPADPDRDGAEVGSDGTRLRLLHARQYVLVGEDGELAGPVAKNLTDAERSGLAAHVGAQAGDCIFFGAGATKPMRGLLGAARLEIGKRCGLVDEGTWSLLWVLDAPLFEPASEAVAAGDVAVGSGAWTAVHHAFTSPKKEFEETFDTTPGEALAYAYDMVCNGNEIAGGSIRIHRREIQERVFAVMGLSGQDAQEKFGFLLDAFAFGAPPHGGIAFVPLVVGPWGRQLAVGRGPTWATVVGVRNAVIVLNGASSSGKSSIALELQRLLPRPFLAFGVDTLVASIPPASSTHEPAIVFGSDGVVVVGDRFRLLEHAWYLGLAAIARDDVGVILDEVLLGGRESQDRLRSALGGLGVVWVGVRCDLEGAVAREVV